MSFPNDPFGNLPDDHRELFWQVPGADYIDAGTDTDYAQALYAVGFGYTSDDYDRMGFDADQVHAAREDFFDFMGLEWEDFPWDEWREVMGYND